MEASVFRKSFVLSGLRINAAVCLFVVTMIAAFSLSGCGGSSTPPSVAVTASAATVDATDKVTLTATITNDQSTNGVADGVTWSVSGGGTLSSQTTTGATYTAPAATSSAQTVTVTATSVADTTKTATATLTVPAKLTVTTTAAQLVGTVGTVYSVQLNTSAGISPYKWSLDANSAALPTGWNLTSGGLLTGPAPVAGQAGTLNLIFDVTDSGTPTPMTASETLALTINPAPVIAFTGTVPATATYNVAYTGSATAGGGVGALTYSVSVGALPTGLNPINTSTGAITGKPTAVGAFPFTVKATDAYGDSNTQGYTITVGSAAQSITFANPGAQTVATPLTLVATASSGLAVSFASTTSSVCTVSGTTATFIATGTCTVQATQAGNADYSAATMVPQSFTVNGEAQTITFANPGTQAVGTPLTLVATASSSLTVSFASTTSSVCTVSGTTATILTTGTCTIQATQAGNSTYAAATPVSQSFSTNGEAQTITFANPGTQTVGTPLTLVASASSTLAVSFASTTLSVCTVSGTTATMLTSGTCTIQATQAGNSTYAVATPVSRSFTVNVEAQNITFTNPGTQTVGTPLTLSASASSGLSVSFASNTLSVCTVSGTSATMLTTGTCTIQATQAGNISYAAATPVSQSFTVNGVLQTITFANPGAQTVGTPLTLSATTTATGLTVAFASTTTSVCTVSGTAATFIASGTCTIQATQAGNSTYAAATPVSQSFTVNTPGAQVSGTISLNNNCGSSVPAITVSINTSPVQTTTTDSNGNYSFASIPAGTYTITPSITGAASLFYPASITGVTLSGSNVNNENFNAALGYTVSGNVSYSGAQTGQTYLYLSGGCGGGNGGPGTSITEAVLTSGGAFTIRGVPPGSYTLQAWMDTIGQQAQNAIDPTNSATQPTVQVSNANVGQAVTLADPTFTTPTENPTISVIIPNAQGVWVEFGDSKNSNGVEDANQYTVEWSTSPTLGGGSGGFQFATLAGSHTFTATGDKGIWVLNNAVVGAGTFTLGQTYYFQARSFDTLDTANPHPSGWCNYTSTGCSGTTGFTGVVIGTPACTGTCATVSSSVTIPAGITINTGAPLYLGMIQFDSNGGDPIGFYVTETLNPVNGANAFTVTVPIGSYYAVIGILDQDKNGGFGAGAISNTNNNLNGNLTITASTTSVKGITLSPANATATISTQWSSSTCQGCGPATTSYQLDFEVDESDKVPVAVTLNSGPNMINTSGTVALDMSLCKDCGNSKFQYSVTLLGETPNVGDPYGFTVTYSDGTQDTGTTVNGVVTAWDSANGGTSVVGPSDAPTSLAPQQNNSTSTTPTFTWTYPANASDFTYQFYIYQSNNCSGSCNGNIWQIPGNNSKTNGFTVAEDEVNPFNGTATNGSLPWGDDPTGGGSTPTGSLDGTGATTYNWSIQVQDLNGNEATTSVWYQP